MEKRALEWAKAPKQHRSKVCKFCGRSFKSAAVRKAHQTRAHRLDIAREIMQQPPAKWASDL